MKVSLVVATGVHEGKVIPITAPQFVIGRDPDCQLRPASAAVSKKHCSVTIRDGKVFVRDHGSTNGTQVNDDDLRGTEQLVRDGDRVRVGPLDFRLRVDASAPAVTPSSDKNLSKSGGALAAVKATSETVAERVTKTDPPSGRTPAPAKKADPKLAAADHSHDDIAAMLLGMDDGEPVPDGSTVMEMPTPEGLAEAAAAGAAAPPAAAAKAKTPSREDSSNAANEILKKMLRRPR